MKKKFLSFAAMVTVALLSFEMVSCGDDDNSSSTNNSASYQVTDGNLIGKWKLTEVAWKTTYGPTIIQTPEETDIAWAYLILNENHTGSLKSKDVDIDSDIYDENFTWSLNNRDVIVTNKEPFTYKLFQVKYIQSDKLVVLGYNSWTQQLSGEDYEWEQFTFERIG